MTTTCPSCGAPNEDTATCRQCGQALPPPPPDTPPPAPDTPPPPAGSPAPPRPTYNPFLGWPVSDYLRDAAAAFCLFASLGMTWDLSGDRGGDKWWVVLSVLLAVAALVLPYLLKANLIPGWTPAHSKLAKLGATAPYLASVIAVLVTELVNVDHDRDGGLGIALGLGTAGVALVLQPRQAEELPSPTDDRMWNRLAYGFGGAAVVAGLVMYAGLLLHASDHLFDDVLVFFKTLLVAPVMLVAVAALPLAGYVGGSAAWRRVFATSTFTLLAVSLLSMADEGTALFYWPQAEKWYGDVFLTGYAGTFLLGAAAGLSVCRSLGRRPSEQVEPVAEWRRTASAAAQVAAAASAVTVAALIIGTVQDTDEIAAAIVITVIAALAGLAAVVAAAMMGQLRRTRVPVLILLGTTMLTGIIAMGVANGQGMNVEGLYHGPALPVTGWLVAAWVSLPALAGGALTVPPAVRAAYGPLIQGTPGYRPTGPQPQQQPPVPPPQQPPPPPPQPPHDAP